MNSKKCVKCGLVNFPAESVCERCKSPLAEGAAGVGADWTHTYGGAGQPAPSFGAQAASDGLYYKPSGEVTVAGLCAGLFGGLLVALVLAFVYSYLIAYIPFVYVNALCTAGYACALGFVVGWLLKSGKMRNPAVGLFVTIIVSLAAYYFSWAVWLSAMLGRGDYDVSAFTLASQPSTLLDVILRVNEHGAWSIGRGGKNPVTGVFLWIVWGVEALIVLVVPPVLAWGVLNSEPFCEFCGEWCEEDQGLVSLGQAEPAGLKQVFESKQFERLKSVGAKGPGAADWYRLDLHHCKRCDKTNTLTVKSEKITFDRKGNSKVESKDILSKLVLSKPEVEELRRVSREMTLPTPAPVREAEPSPQQQEPAAQV
jgi:hypothetical protein